MKKLGIYLILTFLISACALLRPLPEILSVNEVSEINFHNGKNVLLDIRTQEEYDEGHLPEAEDLDFYAEDFENKLDSLDKKKVYYIYCQSGNRSTEAAHMMKEKGFDHVVNLKDGYEAYEQESGTL